jgi:Transposase
MGLSMVCRTEMCAHPARRDRKGQTLHQGQTLLSLRENLTLEGALRTLLRSNKRLNTARLLKGSFDQLWSYKHESWAWRFFDKWRASLKWRRLKAYEKLAHMIDSRWAGIAAYRKPENSLASSRGSTIKSESSNHASTACATKSTFVSRFSLARCRCSDNPCFC